MQALILAGGYGTRLRPLTNNIPKPIVPIGNKPFLLRQIHLLKSVGITDITVSIGYQPSIIEKTLGDGSEYGVNLRYLVESSPMGTAGAYKFAENFINTTTVVLNGDILTDVNLLNVADQHKKYSAAATIILVEIYNPAAYGLVETDKDYKVLRFLEKPNPDQIRDLNKKTVNSGIYILEPTVLGYIPAETKYSFEYQLFPDLLQKNANFRAYIADKDTYWLDIGTPERYLQAHHDILLGKIKNLQTESKPFIEASSSAWIDKFSHLASGCVIKSGTKIINSVIGESVIIEQNCIVQNSVIWSGTRVDSYAKVLDSVIGNDCHVGKNVVVSKNSVLGDNTVIPDFINL